MKETQGLVSINFLLAKGAPLLVKTSRILSSAGLILVLSILVACQSALGSSSSTAPLSEASTNSPTEGQVQEPPNTQSASIWSDEAIITLGDVDPEDPFKKIKRMQPLADYLAENLGEFGIESGDVVIARSIEEMSQFLADGVVDVYMDSAFPSLQAQEASGSRVVARRWKQNAPDYWSTYVVRHDQGIDSVDDFLGKVVAFEEPYSTSGFILPAGMMVDRGYKIVEVSRPGDPVGPDEIGYLFTLDEENTFELVYRGVVAGGGVSNIDFDQLEPGLKDELTTFERTITVPRQFVSVRPGLGQELTGEIVHLLVELEHFERGQELLQSLKNTTRFDALPPESETSVRELQRLIDLVVD